MLKPGSAARPSPPSVAGAMKLLSCLATGCRLLAAAVAPLADYNKHKGARLASVTPSEMLCCGSKCGTIAPIELDTAKGLCNGVTHCWGFSYDPDAKLAKFGAGVTASGTDSYVTPSGFSGAVDGYRSFHYSTRGAFFDITLTHTYQIPSSLCAAQCDDADNCNVFEMT